MDQKTTRLKVRGAALYIGVSARSLADRGWRRKHGIPAIKVGRAVVFDTRDLDAYLNRHRERPALRPYLPRDAEGEGR